MSNPFFSRPIYGLIYLNHGRAVFNEGRSMQRAGPKVSIYGTDFMIYPNHVCWLRPTVLPIRKSKLATAFLH